MTDIQTPAQEAGDEVVAETNEQVEGAKSPEAAETTEGQVKDQPAEAGALDEQSEGTPGEEQVSKSKARRERRKAEMDRLHSDLDAKSAENRKLKDQLAEYERRMGDPAPREADFEDYAEYQAALAAHKSMLALDQREKSRLEGQAAETQQEIDRIEAQKRQEMARDWAAQTVEAKAIYPDFDAVVYAQDTPITQSMAELLTSSDVGADIAYHLGTHKAEAARIAGMTPIEQAMAIGRLEASVSRPRPRTESQAPQPVKPVKGSATPGLKSPDEMSMDEYMAARKSGKLR